MAESLGAQAILNAAIELFAVRGADGVSLADIQEASGHRNRSAINYHFGGKEALIEVLITQTVDAHDQRRVEMFDQLDAQSQPVSLTDHLFAAVSPMIDDLAERSTRLRLRMLANIANDERHMSFIQNLMTQRPGLGRSTAAIASHLTDLPEAIQIERLVLATTFGLQAFADQSRLVDSPHPDRQPLDSVTFSSHIVELLEGLLTAPHRQLS